MIALAAVFLGLTPEQSAIRADVAALADDAMAGREAGTAGYDRAADYVIERFRAAGLSPVPGHGWRQRVSLVALSATGPGTATVTRGGQSGALDPMDIALSLPERPEDEHVSGTLIAAGHCVIDRTAGIDDFAGIDVRGKIVACAMGAPADLSPVDRAIRGAPSEQARAARALGALGIVVVQSKAQAKNTTFVRIARAWRAPRMILAERPDDGRVLALLSAGAAERLFASGKTLTLTLEASAHRRQLASSNIVGWLPGSDARRRHEYVVVSAHLDHLGDDVPAMAGSSDRIANGTLDNAMGVAAMIAVAQRTANSQSRPAASLMFVAFTAEEQGLLGSTWFVRHPPVPRSRTIVNINLDMPILTYDLQDLVLLGGERSGMARLANAAAAEMGLHLTPDPDPDGAAIVRSDQYSFLRAGIPAVLALPGPGGGGAAAARRYRTEHYHRPTDDLSLLINWHAADRFVHFVQRLAHLAAESTSTAGQKVEARAGGRTASPPL